MTFPSATLSIVWIPDVCILRENGVSRAVVTHRRGVFRGCLPPFPWISELAKQENGAEIMRVKLRLDDFILRNRSETSTLGFSNPLFHPFRT